MVIAKKPAEPVPPRRRLRRPPRAGGAWQRQRARLDALLAVLTVAVAIVLASTPIAASNIWAALLRGAAFLPRR